MNNNLQKWLSSALEDPNVCSQMKTDIRQWFDTETIQMSIFWHMAEETFKESLLMFAGYDIEPRKNLLHAEWKYIQECDRKRIMNSIQDNC